MLLDSVDKVIENIIHEVLPQQANESPSEYGSRSQKFIARIRSTIGYSLNHSFIYRLKWLFHQYGWYTDTSNEGDNVGHRAEDFVESRNKLFHEHRFANQISEAQAVDPKASGKLLREIGNIELFIPLLFATILQYRGRYWDTLANKWAWMPQPNLTNSDEQSGE